MTPENRLTLKRIISGSCDVSHLRVRPFMGLHRVTQLCQIARIQWVSITLVGVLGFAGSAAVGLMVGIPEPEVHDEFSYLLAADTFAHGRLTNPTHPLWIHFESIHIIHQPTYMSKYPPAQGLMLAVGQVIGGHPIWGVWMSIGIMYAAITWMLYSWVSPSWALLGGFLAVAHPELGINGYWAQSYWGGAVAATGGALVMGGLRRIMHRPQTLDALLLGIGLAVLANSRPYEGLLFSLPACLVLLLWMMHKHGLAAGVSIRRIVFPIFVVLFLAGTAMGLYNLRVTGNALLMPYQVYLQRYARAPVFLWQTPYPKSMYHRPFIDDFNEIEMKVYSQQSSIAGFLSAKKESLRNFWNFYFGIVFSIPLVVILPVMLPWIFRNRWMLFALLTSSVLIAGLLLETFLNNHYAAPLTGLIFVFVLQALRLWKWRDGLLGRWILYFIVFFFIYLLGRSVYAEMKQGRSPDWRQHRARILKQLEQEPGRHLIIVRYEPKHRVAQEYVYNKADIDNAKVIWARDMGESQNRELLEYFDDRQRWLLEPDNDAIPMLQPYAVKLSN